MPVKGGFIFLYVHPLRRYERQHKM